MRLLIQTVAPILVFGMLFIIVKLVSECRYSRKFWVANLLFFLLVMVLGSWHYEPGFAFLLHIVLAVQLTLAFFGSMVLLVLLQKKPN
jgi:hypothetical protein